MNIESYLRAVCGVYVAQVEWNKFLEANRVSCVSVDPRIKKKSSIGIYTMATQPEVGVQDFVLLDQITPEEFMHNLKIR